MASMSGRPPKSIRNGPSMTAAKGRPSKVYSAIQLKRRKARLAQGIKLGPHGNTQGLTRDQLIARGLLGSSDEHALNVAKRRAAIRNPVVPGEATGALGQFANVSGPKRKRKQSVYGRGF
jgi:hypothetical protein